MRCWRDLTPHTRVSFLSRHAHNHPWDAVTSSRRATARQLPQAVTCMQQVLEVKTRPHVIRRLLVRRGRRQRLRESLHAWTEGKGELATALLEGRWRLAAAVMLSS